MSSQASLLGGLVHGFAEEKTRLAHEALDQSKAQQQQMLQYLGHLASSPNIPPEHQQWAMGKMQEIINAKPGGKLPKVDLNELPPVSTPAGPTRTTQPTLPAMQLQPPVGPGGTASPSAPAAASAPSGDVGRASDSTVNAMGNITPPVGPSSVPGYSGAMPIASVRPGDTGPANVPNSIVGMPDAQGRPTLVPNAPPSLNAPISPMTLPPMPQAQIQNPMPPQQISAGGLHVLTPEDRQKFANVDSANQMEKLRSQFPGKSEEELAHYAKTGEFPKPSLHEVAPGGKLVDERGRTVAENTNKKPGEKSGYEPKMGPGGPIGIVDVATGGMLTPEQVAANPQAKAVLDQAKQEHQSQMDAQDARDDKKAERAQALADQHEEAGRRKLVYGQAVDSAKKAKPMVDVLDASEDYMKSGTFTPRQDLALIVRAVRAMNPGTVRLPQKELEMEIKAGSYGDRFSRWYSTASEGVLPTDQRNDLMNVIRTETTTTATSAAENWRDAFKGTKEEEPPTYLRRFEAKQGSSNGTGPGQFTVTDPKGGVHVFPDQASADRFKAAIGGGK